jgi:hypothetical protein
MNSTIKSGIIILTMCVVAGCGSGGGGGESSQPAVPSTTMKTIYYDEPTNTIIKEEGLVLVGADGKPTDIKHGQWKIYFPPADGNGLQFEKSFANGTWDENQMWTEYNADSSIRDTMADAIF